MKTKAIDIKTADGLCDSYVAFPEQQSNLPVVIFYMDAIGLRQRLYDMVETIAAKGYYVIAPNVFYRSRRAPVVDYAQYLKPENFGEMIKLVMPMVAELTPDLSKRDAEAFLKFAKEQPEADARKIGAVGYCMGGTQALRAAANFPDSFKAVASYHAGRLATDDENSVHRLFHDIKAELYFAHADNDQSMPPEMIERTTKALEEAKANFHSELYVSAKHGFTMADLPAHDAAAEQRHWDALFALFKKTLK